MHEDDPLWPEIDEAGARIDRRSYIWVCVLDEEDPVWSSFKDRLLENSGRVSSRAVYSEEELKRAPYLEIIARGHHGYPQPERNFGYVKEVYEKKGYCEGCGIGARQKAPFRIRKEFGARHSHFLQLNWVFDEFFVRAPVVEALIDAGVTGISWQAPVIHKSGAPSAEVEQMMVENSMMPSLDAKGFPTVTCKANNEEGRPHQEGDSGPYCGRMKFHRNPALQLRFDASTFECTPDIVKTAEWFGSGGSAFRLILVSQKVYRLITEAGWRGVEFEPVKLVS
ncbi:MAG: hypothetical protein ACR2O1_00405 [Boseongicola sp.]